MRWLKLRSYLRWGIVLPLFGAMAVGAGATIASVEFNKHTSTDAFCTSCHSMSSMTADSHYKESAHVANSAGVHPNCGSCHIPTTNWFIETYTHVRSGIRDVIAEMTTDFGDLKGWEARRREMAAEVRNDMRAQGNATCVGCHTTTIKPASQTGQAVHASLPEGVACVSCHRNLIHARPGSLSAADETNMIKRAADDWVHSRHLSNIHAQKNVSCNGCHGDDLIPDANATTANAQCANCHGGMQDVAQNFKGPPYLNPHASHLGNIPCSSCHKVHQESKAYCLNCHTNFNMPIPGGADATLIAKP